MKVEEMIKKTPKTAQKAEMDEAIKKLRKEYSKLVKGKFEFTEAVGGWLEFTYKFFPGEPIQKYTITHGEICELPLGVVKILNNCVKKVRKYDMSSPAGMGKMPKSFSTESRLKFTPSEYM